MSDFDYWPKASLAVLVRALRGRERPPSPSNVGFWQDLVEQCARVDDEDEVTMTASELANDVRSEFEQARFVYPSTDRTDVAVGDRIATPAARMP